MINNDIFHIPHKLIGYVRPDVEPPTFVIPVFRNLESDALAVQVSDLSDLISDFEKLRGNYIRGSMIKNTIKKLRDPVLFGLLTLHGDFFCLHRSDFSDKLRILLDQGEFDGVPAFGLTVAKFINDSNQEKRLKKIVYDNTLVALTKTRKFFLENNVVREGLYGKLPVEYADIIRRTKIDIVGNTIKLAPPNDLQKSELENIASEVSRTYKDFINSSDFSIEFDGHKSNIEKLRRDIMTVRNGKFDYNPNILDFPKAKYHFSSREALILIPEALPHYYSYIDKSFASRNLVSIDSAAHTISDATIRRILKVDSVSLISAIMFRFRLLGDLSDALSLEEMKLHVACFAIKESSLSYEKQHRIKNELCTRREGVDPDFIIRTTLMPLSMVMLMIKMGLLDNEDISVAVSFSRNGYYSRHRFNDEFFRLWVEYCRNSFKSHDLSIAEQFDYPDYVK